MRKRKNKNKEKITFTTAADFANEIKKLPKANKIIFLSSSETGEKSPEIRESLSQSTSRDKQETQNETTNEFKKEITELRFSTIKSDIERSCNDLISKHQIGTEKQISDYKSTTLMWSIGTVVVIIIAYIASLIAILPMFINPKFESLSNEIDLLKNRVSPVEIFIEDQKANHVSDEFSMKSEPK